ncbi:MAG: hypothetical protein IIX19_05945 [Alistipes sp.]|nr:hypothetical protein [Alistipes sp.]
MKTKHLFIAAIVAILTMTSCSMFGGGDGSRFTYAPWPDLSAHFDLSKIETMEGSNILKFNTAAITAGRVPMTSDRLDNGEYNATVLGRSVVLRSNPVVSAYTKITNINTGDKLTVTRNCGYQNGHYWSYVYVNTGRAAGYQGFVCTDFIVGSEQYEMIDQYVIRSGSNLSIYYTDSKKLHAIADVLIKFQADKRHPNLNVSLLNEYPFGHQSIVVYQIRDYGMQNNNCMLAIVQFTQNSNDFVVLGVVPGNTINSIQPIGGSYDVYFN